MLAKGVFGIIVVILSWAVCSEGIAELCPFLQDPSVLSSRSAEIQESLKYFATESGPHKAVSRRNFIDEQIFSKAERDRIPTADICTDGEFIRRIYLDLTGRIPSAQVVRAFLEDRSPDKRDRLVDSLIGTPEYVDRWTMWFNDRFRNTIYPVSARGRNLLHAFIKDFVQRNRPYNDVATDLITPGGDSFSNGPLSYLLKAGTAGDLAQLDTIDDMSIAVARDFLGLKILCISCHQGRGYLDRINLWLARKTREDFWSEAAFFVPMEIEARQLADMMSYRYNVADRGPSAYDPANYDDTDYSFRPIRRVAQPLRPSFILSRGEPQAGETSRRALARLITSDRQFARATVNYLWAQFMVTGIVDPPDGFDLARQDPNNPPTGDDVTYWRQNNLLLQPSHPELLEALAQEFISNRYNLQHIIKLICKSNAYQLSSRFSGQWRPEYARYYVRKVPKLMSAEELHDSIIVLTGIPANYALYGSSERVRWAMQLRGPEEPANQDLDGYEGFGFMEPFGRPDRVFNDRVVNKLSLFQPLALMHSSFVTRRVDSNADGNLRRLLASGRNDRQIIDELFLGALARFPTATETKLGLIQMRIRERDGAEDVLWSLMNKLDFFFNY